MASEFIDLVSQTAGVLPRGHGGTGNSYGWAYGTVVGQANKSGSTWAQYSALAWIGQWAGLTTTANPGPFIGVVVGTLQSDGQILPGPVADQAVAAVQVNGVVPMLVDSGAGYGYFVSTGGGAASGHVIGTAAQTADAVGVLISPSLVQLLAGGAVSSVGFLSTAVLQAGDLSGVVATGDASVVMVPWACELTSVSLFGDQVGSAVVDIYAGAESLYPPSTSIVSATPPTLSSASHYADSTLTGWTTTFAAHTVFKLHVTSASTVTQLTLQLVLRQTA